MKLWWSANLYWFTLIAYLNIFLFSYRYDDGSYINPFVVVFLLIAVCVMIVEFQFTWYMWVAQKTYKPRKRKHQNSESVLL